jgi:hypothetical protein
MNEGNVMDGTAQRLLDRLDAIAAVLSARPDALALLALGSVGRETGRLDGWSDLDFFVIVREGSKQAYIDDLSWLGQAHRLAWHFRNTQDGHKALMADGIFCEFAVFEVRELHGIAYAPGRFVWRRDEVPDGLALPERAMPAPAQREWLVGEALSNLIVGLQRHARGERLTAMRMVQVHALDRVLELLDLDAAAARGRDPFSVDRRVEQRHPLARTALADWAPGYAGTLGAALRLLDALESRTEVPALVSAHIRGLASQV